MTDPGIWTSTSIAHRTQKGRQWMLSLLELAPTLTEAERTTVADAFATKLQGMLMDAYLHGAQYGTEWPEDMD